MTQPKAPTPEERIARGEEARLLLEHPLMKACLENYHTWSFEQFKAADINGTHQELGDHLIWLRMLDQAQQNFTEYFERFVRDGENAAREMLDTTPITPRRSVESYGDPRS